MSRFLPAFALLLVLVAAISSMIGSISISARDLLTGTGHAPILFAIRAPRVVLGILVGAGLGIAGAAMQGVFRNPLIDPGLLGISNGAALGAVASIVLGAKLAFSGTAWGLPLAAFLGALAATALLQWIARTGGERTNITTFLLAGIAVNALAAAAMGYLIYAANDAQMRTITFWTMGSLAGATWNAVAIAAVFLLAPTAYLALRNTRRLDVLLLGESEATSLGVDVEATRRLVILGSALVVGASVALTGVLAFVGLVVPHLTRLAVGPRHRVLLPASALLGGSLLVAADAVARVAVAPAELPLGIVTASLGTPFFLTLLVRERRRSS